MDMRGYTFPRVLVCGDKAEAEPPFWAEATAAIAQSYLQPLEIDVCAELSDAADVESLKTRLSAISEEIYTEHLGHVPITSLPITPRHTHILLAGIEPPSVIPDTITVFYTPTPECPVTSAFPFSRLPVSTYMILNEPQARGLLASYAAVETKMTGAGLSVVDLARRLVAIKAIERLRGLIITRGTDALEGCFASAIVVLPPDPAQFKPGYSFIDDDEEEEPQGRYELEVPPAIIHGGPVDTRGSVAAFLGRFISALVALKASTGPIEVLKDDQLSFQLEQSCVCSALAAMVQGCSLDDLPTMDEMGKNMGRYMHGLPMLKKDEPADSRESLQKLGRPTVTSKSQPAPAQKGPPKVSSSATTAATTAQTTCTSAKEKPSVPKGFKRGFLKGGFS